MVWKKVSASVQRFLLRKLAGLHGKANLALRVLSVSSSQHESVFYIYEGFY